MKMKATDTFHTSQTKTVLGGQEFEIHDALGKELEAKGLATRVGSSKTPEPTAETAPAVEEHTGEKVAPPIANKAEPAPKNKKSEG
jgi:hypothetical protein